MEKGSTKERILEVSLELFSKKGFEATSTAQIADAVHIRKASLYSHYASKQDILDTLIAQLMEEYNRNSLFANADWEDPVFTKDKENLTPQVLTGMVKGQMRYILHDPKISRVRKMLMIEQFQNPELAVIQSKQSYGDILKYNRGLMQFMIRQGILRDEDAEIMAAQFCWPISMWITLCDREPEREAEVMELIERHILQFYRIYGA